MKTYQINITNLDKLQYFIENIALNISDGVFFLHGDLGVGKTTFVQLYIKSIGYKGNVTSPSYGIINQYTTPENISILHADLYRLAEPQELLYLDVDEWAEMANIIFIEWPEKGADYLPKPDVDIYMLLKNNKRYLRIQVNNTFINDKLMTNSVLSKLNQNSDIV